MLRPTLRAFIDMYLTIIAPFSTTTSECIADIPFMWEICKTYNASIGHLVEIL